MFFLIFVCCLEPELELELNDQILTSPRLDLKSLKEHGPQRLRLMLSTTLHMTRGFSLHKKEKKKESCVATIDINFKKQLIKLDLSSMALLYHLKYAPPK